MQESVVQGLIQAKGRKENCVLKEGCRPLKDLKLSYKYNELFTCLMPGKEKLLSALPPSSQLYHNILTYSIITSKKEYKSEINKKLNKY